MTTNVETETAVLYIKLDMDQAGLPRQIVDMPMLSFQLSQSDVPWRIGPVPYPPSPSPWSRLDPLAWGLPIHSFAGFLSPTLSGSLRDICVRIEGVRDLLIVAGWMSEEEKLQDQEISAGKHAELLRQASYVSELFVVKDISYGSLVLILAAASTAALVMGVANKVVKLVRDAQKKELAEAQGELQQAKEVNATFLEFSRMVLPGEQLESAADAIRSFQKIDKQSSVTGMTNKPAAMLVADALRTVGSIQEATILD
jgi:hypothetical protein